MRHRRRHDRAAAGAYPDIETPAQATHHPTRTGRGTGTFFGAMHDGPEGKPSAYIIRLRACITKVFLKAVAMLTQNESLKMTDSNSTSPPDIPRLPELKVIQEKYCSQEVTDSIIRLLQEKRPDLVFNLIDPDQMTIRKVWKNFHPIVEYLRSEAAKHIDIPQSRLAMIDIIYELYRRTHLIINPGKNFLSVQGQAIAAGPDEPMPALPKLKVKEYKVSGMANVSQECVDLVSDKLHELRPDLLYEISETMRRNIPPIEVNSEFEAFLELLRTQVKNIPVSNLERYRLWDEIQARVGVLSKIEFWLEEYR